MKDTIEQMTASNDAALKALAANGVNIEQSSLMNVRLQMLTEALLGDMDAEPRLEFELAVQHKFAELIADIQSQVNRAKLLAGIHG